MSVIKRFMTVVKYIFYPRTKDVGNTNSLDQSTNNSNHARIKYEIQIH